MDLDSAVQKHNEWKVKFRSAISKKETLDAATISKDNCCEFGKWLYGAGKAEFGGLSSFTECLAKHKVFHVEAGKVAAAINAKKYVEAEAMIGAGTGYSAASTDTGVAIMHLKKESAA